MENIFNCMICKYKTSNKSNFNKDGPKGVVHKLCIARDWRYLNSKNFQLTNLIRTIRLSVFRLFLLQGTPVNLLKLIYYLDCGTRGEFKQKQKSDCSKWNHLFCSGEILLIFKQETLLHQTKRAIL